jgi:hypothetical protein
MIRNISLAVLLVALASNLGRAAITTYAEYHLGEAGSMTGNVPVDSSGNSLTIATSSGAGTYTTGTVGVFAPGSTAYVDTSEVGNRGWYGANTLFSTLTTDNFAFGIYAQAAGNTTQIGDVFTVGGANGSFKLSLDTTGWRASSNNVTYFGSTAPFTANTWVHLAVIRSNGSSTFYVNGVAQGGTYAAAPVHGAPHISVSPGGATYFDGLLDEARVVTFTAGESTANILGALTATPVPEPATYFVLGLGAFGLLAQRMRATKK